MTQETGHHSPEQIRAAFGRAPKILAELKAAGLPLARFVLFEDGSGQLVLGKESGVTRDQWRRAAELIHSERLRPCYACLKEEPPEHDHEVVIDFCCGLVAAAGGHPE